jgi:pSer/pThr/pTyr-binding forkhead associated (FHA) protein
MAWRPLENSLFVLSNFAFRDGQNAENEFTLLGNIVSRQNADLAQVAFGLARRQNMSSLDESTY